MNTSLLTFNQGCDIFLSNPKVICLYVFLFLSCLLWMDSRANILLSCLPGRVVLGWRIELARN